MSFLSAFANGKFGRISMSSGADKKQGPQDIIAETTSVANDLFPLAQESYVYRASIAYILQNIKSFVAAIQPFQASKLSPMETQSLQRFIGIVNHFAKSVLPLINKSKWTQFVLQNPSTHIHSYIDDFRKSLIDICNNLNLDSNHVVKYDPMQDAVNKNADFQHLKKVLRDAREKKISVKNSVDIQQSIEVRLHSIQSHLPKNKAGKIKNNPSLDNLPISELQQRMDRELSVFKKIDIPCEDLNIDVALGCGGFGTVFKATRLSTSELLAVKEVRSDKLSMSTWASLYSEVATMTNIHHRYVLELVGTHVKEPYRIITRFCPGKSLFDRLHRGQSPLSPQRLTMIAYQVAEGMRFLHSHCIVHRDLKTMNILLDENDAAKIADFGLAGVMRDKDEVLMGGVGTPHYTAPEVLERKRYGPKVDTYSYGVILWEMAVKQIPFREKTHQEIYDHVVTHGWRLPLNNSIPEPLKKLINRCWSQNPNDRPEFSEIVELFESGKIFFRGCEKLSKSELETPEGCPPLDIPYLTNILSNPSDEKFKPNIDFLEKHIDSNIRSILQKAKIIVNYNAQSKNAPYILLIAKEILQNKEFKGFIQETGNTIIKQIMVDKEPTSVIAAVKFCLKVPDDTFSLIKEYIPAFVEIMNNRKLSPFILRLIARLEKSEILKIQKKIVELFNPNKFVKVKDQSTLDAVAKLISIVADSLNEKQFESCIQLIYENNLDCPPFFIDLVIEKTSKSANVKLLNAVIKAAERTDVTGCMIKILRRCSQEDIRAISRSSSVLDQIQRLLETNKSVETALLLLFSLSTDEEITPQLANHPVLNSLLQLEGHVAQRLQIFTALFSVEQFCSDTTISDGVLKLLVSSLEDEKLTDYSMKLIGALSSHQSGCMLISGNGMLSLFSQMFLSSAKIDMPTALTILSNIATKLQNQEIPQLSLIISILMQDLIYSVTNKSDILQTLINLIKLSPSSVQEHDLQNSVLPLLSSRQEPVIIVLVLNLFDACDMPKLKNFYQQIAQKIFNILTIDSMMYPELLSAAFGLIASIAMQYDLTQFIEQTQIVPFFTDIANQITDYEEIHASITNCLYCLSGLSHEQEQGFCDSPLASEEIRRQAQENSFGSPMTSSAQNDINNIPPDKLEMPDDESEEESSNSSESSSEEKDKSSKLPAKEEEKSSSSNNSKDSDALSDPAINLEIKSPDFSSIGDSSSGRNKTDKKSDESSKPAAKTDNQTKKEESSEDDSEETSSSDEESEDEESEDEESEEETSSNEESSDSDE